MTADPLNIPPVEVPQITRHDPRAPTGAAVSQPFRSEVTFAEGAVGFAEVATSSYADEEGAPVVGDGEKGPGRRKDGMSSKVNVASRRFFVKIANPMSAVFSDAIVLPSLQFVDRTMEAQYQRCYFTSIRRITYTVLVGWFLNALQMWFGLYKGWLGINESRRSILASTTTTTPAPTAAIPARARLAAEFGLKTRRSGSAAEAASPLGSLLDWSLLSSFSPVEEPRQLLQAADDGFEVDNGAAPRCLWGKEETTAALRADANLFEAACINQTVADSIILFFWWLFSSLKRYYRKLEAITIATQITRVILIVLFAQGMWSDCARNQGPTDIMMNNIAIASANVTYFNCVPICRVRRGCVVTAIFAVGVLEIIIVMTQGTTGGAAMSPHDAAQLTMYILIFVFTPVVALICRFRTELSERESYYLSILHDQISQTNAGLQAELEDLNKVRDMDIEQSLPEGLLPSKIVHVAVRELQQAERCAEHLQKSLPSIFLQQTRSSQRRNLEGTDQRILTARKIGKAMEFAMELKESVQSALKLLCRSHDIYTPAIHGNYAGAMMFHAIGHAMPKTEDGGLLSQEGDDTTEGFGDNPPSLLSRNTARKCDGAALGGGDNLDSVELQISQTAFGAAYNENTNGEDPNAGSPRVADVEEENAARDMTKIFGNADFPFLSGLGEMARNIGSNWQFDMLKVTRVTKDESIITTGMLLASPIAEGIQFDWKRWFAFLRSVQNEYGSSNAIPYHNRTHSSIHAHTCAVLLDWLKHAASSTKLESLGVLVSSLCHDIGHPGRTNAYLVNANKRLAIIYNDISVLENYHSCRTFEILMQKQNNFISSIGLEDYRYIRKVIIELILATDMKQHFELINNYKLQRNTPSFNIWSQENKLSTLKLIMKAADLSHGALDWNLHNVLSMSVNEEFWAQGDAEMAMGLPISPLCDRNISKEELASSQAGFLEFLVLPLYKELGAVDSTGIISATCEGRIRSNIEKWKAASTPAPLGEPVCVESTVTSDSQKPPAGA